MKTIVIISALLLVLSSCSKKIMPEKPQLGRSQFLLDSLPLSEIDIPLQINLKPFYGIAGKKSGNNLYFAQDGPMTLSWIIVIHDICTGSREAPFRSAPLEM